MKYGTLVNETSDGITPDVDPGVEAEDDGWQGPSQEDWQQLQEQNAYLYSQVQQLQPREEGSLGPPPDPAYQPEEFARWLDMRDEQRLGPIQQYIQHSQGQESNELAYDIIADVESREGEFLLRETTQDMPLSSPQMARAIADDLMPDYEGRYGHGSAKAAEAALEQAVKYVRAYEDEIGRRYMERKENELRTRMSAPMQPSNNGAAAQNWDSGAASEMDVVARHTGVGIIR